MSKCQKYPTSCLCLTLYKCFVSQHKPCEVLKKIRVCRKVAAAEKGDAQKNNMVFEFCPKKMDCWRFYQVTKIKRKSHVKVES